MNSKIETSTRVARHSACVLSLLLVLTAACSGSRSALSTEPLGAAANTSASKTSNLPACGSMTKPCDPNNLGGQTCSSLGAGSGTLMCDPVTCSYDRSMCTATGTQGGGGLGALLGAFGRGQGGRPAMGMMNTGMGRGGRGGEAAGGRGGSQGSREDGQNTEEGSGGEQAEGGKGGDQAEGGEGGSNEESMANGGAGGEAGQGGESGQAGDAATQAGSGGDAGASTAGAGGESGAPAAMSEMPAMMMPAP